VPIPVARFRAGRNIGGPLSGLLSQPDRRPTMVVCLAGLGFDTAREADQLQRAFVER
jgi:hypothetical protein